MPPHLQSSLPYTVETYTYQALLIPTAKNIQKQITIERLKSTWNTLPQQAQKHMPSALSALTSIPFGLSTCTDNTNNFSPDEFKIFLQRKLSLPLWPALPRGPLFLLQPK